MTKDIPSRADTRTFELPNAFTIYPPAPDITMKLIFLVVISVWRDMEHVIVEVNRFVIS